MIGYVVGKPLEPYSKVEYYPIYLDDDHIVTPCVQNPVVAIPAAPGTSVTLDRFEEHGDVVMKIDISG